MKISFLGTSHGVPEKDRFCSCTMIEVGENLYFIDAGAPVVDLIIRSGRKVESSRAMFTTHCHSDHTNGIVGFADILNWYYKKASVDIYMTEEKHAEATVNLVEASSHLALDRERVRFKVIDEGFVYDDGNIKVTAFPTEHLNRGTFRYPSFGYIVEADGKRAVFSGDLSNKLKYEDFPKIALEEDVDLLVCEMAHFKIADIAPYLEKCKTKKLLFNHVGYTESFESLKALDGKYPYPVGLALDGDTVEL